MARSAFAITQSAAIGRIAASVINRLFRAVGTVSAAIAYSQDSKKCEREGEESDKEKGE